MAIHKVTFVFDGRQCGWSESHWLNSIDASHEITMDAAKKLAAKRAALLGVECFIKAIRVSTEGTGPDAMLRYVRYRPKFIESANGDLVGEKAAQKDVALQIRMENAAHTQHKLVFLRGIWDAVESDQGEYIDNDEWRPVIDAYRKLLLSGPWGWFGSTGRTKVKLSNVQRGINTDSAVFSFAANLFPDGLAGKRVKIRISGVNGGQSNLNGVHVVSVTDRMTCSTEFPLAVSNRVENGWGSYNTYDFIQYASFDDQKIVTRETGAPLLESPGRRPRKARG
jgi:hypothetical protein